MIGQYLHFKLFEIMVKYFKIYLIIAADKRHFEMLIRNHDMQTVKKSEIGVLNREQRIEKNIYIIPCKRIPDMS
jgi:hypothetical protein